MSWPLMLACLWAIVAHLIAMLPSRDQHWRAASVLIAVGIPLVGWVTFVEGPWIGLIVLGAGASVLRWPLWYLSRWVMRRVLTEKE